MLTILFLLYCAIKTNTLYDLYTSDEEQLQFIRKRKIASTLTFLGGCFAATNI